MVHAATGTGTSFNGRTPASGAGYWGSNPCVPANSLAHSSFVAVTPIQSHRDSPRLSQPRFGSSRMGANPSPMPSLRLARIPPLQLARFARRWLSGTSFRLTRSGAVRIPGRCSWHRRRAEAGDDHRPALLNRESRLGFFACASRSALMRCANSAARPLRRPTSRRSMRSATAAL